MDFHHKIIEIYYLNRKDKCCHFKGHSTDIFLLNRFSSTDYQFSLCSFEIIVLLLNTVPICATILKNGTRKDNFFECEPTNFE